MKSSANKPVPTGKVAPNRSGPIRLEAVVPLAIVLFVVTFYFWLFFDSHLRRAMEYGATLANGAEVDIGRVSTKLWDASLTVSDIAMTDPAQPATNRLQIGDIRFHMQWDALLRGKVVINEASITGVQIDTPRKTPGRVPAKQAAAGPGVGDTVLAQTRQAFAGNALGDLAAFAAGADPGAQLVSIGDNLKSSARIAAMQKSLADKKQQWQTRIAALPKAADFTALQNRLAQVKPDDLKDVTQVQSSLKELGAIRSEFDAKSQSVRDAGTALSADFSTSRGSFSGLDKLVKEDVRDLQTRMHLPALDAHTLSNALFGTDVLGKVQQAHGYMELARRYMPTRGAKPAAPPARARSSGHDYTFARTGGYPRFWLRKALISSKLSGGTSTLSGEIDDLSTNPALTGRPMIATINGDFPQQGVSDIKAELVINHLSAVPVERLVMKVGRYAVNGRSLVNSPDLALGFSRAEGSAHFTAQLIGDSVDVRMRNQFRNVTLESRSKSAVVQEMMNASVAGLNAVDLDAHVSGPWSQLDWQLSTNLADALAQGMRRYLQGRMDQTRARIEAQVNATIDAQRKTLVANMADTEAGLKSSLTEPLARIDALRSKLDTARDALEKRKKALLGAQQQKLKQGSDKLLDTLRKKF